MTSRQDVEQLQAALAEVSQGAKDKLVAIFTSIDQDYPDEIRDAMLEVMPALVREHGEQSAAVAADWYEMVRSKDRQGPFRARAAATYPNDAVTKRVRSAMGHAFRGDSAKALEVLQTSLDKFVKQPGRDTIRDSARRDKATWARIPRGASTCGFCLMLASRGFVYDTEEKAGGGRSEFHGNCDCAIVPSFGRKPPIIEGYDPDALYRDYLAARDYAGSDEVAIAERMGVIARRRTAIVPDEPTWEHILFGDPDALDGGHLFGANVPGKTQAPPGWDRDTFETAIRNVQASATPRVADDVAIFEGLFDSVIFRVVLENDVLLSAYPLRGDEVTRFLLGVRTPVPLQSRDRKRYRDVYE